jgi:GTP cyclohydrolase I
MHRVEGKKPLSVPTLSQIVEIADRLFPFDTAENWDNSGIQIGDSAGLIRSIAFSLDPTPETITFAADRSCQLLITHHPLILEPIRNLVPDTLAKKTLLRAAQAQVHVLSLHTNLDAAEQGLNAELARRIGLQDVFMPVGAPCARQGRLAFPMRVRDLAEKVCKDLEIVRGSMVSDPERMVETVFCVSGSGMGYLDHAVKSGAHVMITGDVRYHAAREAAAAGISVIDAGHFGLEKIAIPLLSESFQREFDRLGFEVSCVCCDLEEEPLVDIYKP